MDLLGGIEVLAIYRGQDLGKLEGQTSNTAVVLAPRPRF